MGFLAFFLFGLIQAGYGPLFPLLGREYSQTVATVGTVSSLHFAGAAIGTVLLGPLLLILSLRSSLMVAGIGLAAGLLGVAFAPTWAALLAGAAVSGLAFGMLSAGFNLAFAELGPGPSNLVNGLFGVGSVVSPLMVALLTRESHRLPFVLMAVLTALLALGVRLLWPKAPTLPPAQPSVKVPTETPGDGVSIRPTSATVLALFGLCFFLYVGIEAGFGTWATTYFTRLGADQPALLTSFYWLALTAGRFFFAAVGDRFPPLHILIFALTGAMVGSAVMLLGGLTLAPCGLAFAGFCIAPIFSTQLASFTRTLAPRLAPYMLTLGSLGGAVLPALTGLALPRFGTASVPLTPLLIAVLLLAAVSVLYRQGSVRAASAERFS